MPFKTLLWSLVRSYSNGPAKSRLGKKALSLDHLPLPAPQSQFLQRSRAISLYREIIRGTRRIADPNTRAESRRFAREEFERHRGVTDLGHIRYLISTGKTEWQGMERYVDGM
ncbi:complex 1 protein [Colletotrichum graminicola M1.001]|uniref:LYR motif-containing protein 2 n=1 Tax=Colletotrichum graminicola (strain M1.001 / M2 / FGSC 10212) TaxID=645133 RepID=E3QLU1_COLGM|nr:complex 1 protein [Colletotrichum graminicola M1.001]EFQ31829.1 complex 1 protein [Colletotrichum graminicola M1.001]